MAKNPQISLECRWLQGPQFLLQMENEWPIRNNLIHRKNNVLNKLKQKEVPFLFDKNRFSQWSRVLRTVAYVLRFIKNCQRSKIPLNQAEFLEAESLIFHQVQNHYFREEILLLKSNKPKSSSIFSKNPYLENGILRVAGRIDYADVYMD